MASVDIAENIIISNANPFPTIKEGINMTASVIRMQTTKVAKGVML